MKQRIYVASSWRNIEQPSVVQSLRLWGHEVYDFREPKPGNHGFHWSEVDPNWQDRSAKEFIKSLDHPRACEGFDLDWDAMNWATAGVLLLPCGRSAHLEAGYFVGARKPLYILLGDNSYEPELMYRMATTICVDLMELIGVLGPKVAVSEEK